MRSDNLHTLPDDLPVPQNDGACDHLAGTPLPPITLQATSGENVDISKAGTPWVVIYCYPRMGKPDREPLGGTQAWNAIPGARGCTPQSCAYRVRPLFLTALAERMGQDKFDELRKLANTEYFDIMLLHYQHVGSWPTDTVRWQDSVLEAKSKKVIQLQRTSSWLLRRYEDR